MIKDFERAEWHELGSLDQAATLEALTEPAAAAGRPFDPAAAAELAGETGGYPYAIQLYGHHAWRTSAGQDQITLDAARQEPKRVGRSSSVACTRNGGRRRPPESSSYLLGLASQHAERQTMNGGAVARRLGATPAQLSQHRVRLIEKGTIVAEEDTLSLPCPAWPHTCYARPARARRAGSVDRGNPRQLGDVMRLRCKTRGAR